MPGFETIAVIVIVGAAASWALHSVWRSVRQKRICSDCATSGECPVANGDLKATPLTENVVGELEVLRRGDD